MSANIIEALKSVDRRKILITLIGLAIIAGLYQYFSNSQESSQILGDTDSVSLGANYDTLPTYVPETENLQSDLHDSTQPFKLISGPDEFGAISALKGNTPLKCGVINVNRRWYDNSLPDPNYDSSLPIRKNASEILMAEGIGQDGMDLGPYWIVRGLNDMLIDYLNDPQVNMMNTGTLFCVKSTKE